MNRIGLCATIVAALSAISFPSGALMSGSAASHDANAMSTKAPVVSNAPALSPDGRPVRVISLSVSDRPGDGLAAPARPEMSPLVVSDLTPTSATKPMAGAEAQAVASIRPELRVHSAPKSAPAAPRLRRAASIPAKNAFIVSGLF
jgi:hypothetical protein